MERSAICWIEYPRPDIQSNGCDGYFRRGTADLLRARSCECGSTSHSVIRSTLKDFDRKSRNSEDSHSHYLIRGRKLSGWAQALQ